MRIVIIGGGAAGLYFAILMKKGQPEHDITVYERNRQDDTFGFGVVFSDETLGNFLSYDPETYHQITEEFSYWDEIDFVFKVKPSVLLGTAFAVADVRSYCCFCKSVVANWASPSILK